MMGNCTNTWCFIVVKESYIEYNYINEFSTMVITQEILFLHHKQIFSLNNWSNVL